MSTVVSLATPGLGNRIKTYVSSMAKYDQVKTCRDSDTILFGAIEKASSEEVANFPNVDGWRLDVDAEEEKYIKDYKTIDFLYEKTPDYFIKKYSKIFCDLNVNPQILDTVEKFSEEWDNFIGLHIRSWYCQRNSWHSVPIFEEKIEKLNQDKKIFLCTDNLSVSDYFTSKYGDRIVKYPQTLYNSITKAESGYNHDVSDNVNALIDMLLLSKCSTIVGTFASSFTECAWWFGGCKSNVIIPVPSNVPQDFINDVFSLK
jgi:hypothetical protein